jgi:hypothetical protein
MNQYSPVTTIFTKSLNVGTVTSGTDLVINLQNLTGFDYLKLDRINGGTPNKNSLSQNDKPFGITTKVSLNFADGLIFKDIFNSFDLIVTNVKASGGGLIAPTAPPSFNTETFDLSLLNEPLSINKFLPSDIFSSPPFDVLVSNGVSDKQIYLYIRQLGVWTYDTNIIDSTLDGLDIFLNIEVEIIHSYPNEVEV